MITAASLKSRSLKDLSQMAKQGGVRGWHSMRKDQLVKALLTAAKSKSSATNGKKLAAPARRSTAKTNGAATAHKPTNGRVQRHLNKVKAQLERAKNVSVGNGNPNKRAVTERIVVMVSRSLLAARLLGSQTAERRARAGRDEA